MCVHVCVCLLLLSAMYYSVGDEAQEGVVTGRIRVLYTGLQALKLYEGKIEGQIT